MKESAKLYLVLGTPQSGRREIICDLIEGSSDFQDTNHFVLINKNEPNNSFTKKLQTLSNTHVIEWEYLNNQLLVPNFELADNAKVFFILSGKDDLIDQIESFKNWLDEHPEFSLTRVLSTIDCQLAQDNEELLPWFEAVIYFSDYVFLTRRELVSEKWVNDFIKSFEKQLYPCVFEKVKKYHVTNPDTVLNDEARRISHLFDNLDAIDTLEIDENNLPEEPFELKIKEDPYLERGDDGKRIIKLPSISSK